MDDTKEYLYALDYSDCTICEIALDEEDEKLDTSEILYRRHMNIDTCSVMYTRSRINEITPVIIQR